MEEKKLDGKKEPELGLLLGRLWGRSKVEMEKAARWGRDTIALRQMRTDRDRMYQKLGKEARHLLEAGEIRHPGLERAAQSILEMEQRIREAEDAARMGERAPEPKLSEEPAGETGETPQGS